jgi:hypothetical protein
MYSRMQVGTQQGIVQVSRMSVTNLFEKLIDHCCVRLHHAMTPKIVRAYGYKSSR